MSGAELNSENIMTIMIATDNHLGYCEKDPVRGEDSFTTFEEILQLAVEKDVDFILLGGDLFHDATPSQNALHKCLKILRNYTLGDRPISIEFLSDQTLAFHDAPNQTVNYEDPNINVSIPVFSIHGNHDDPSGFGRLSSLNLLATTGLINYFGRWTDLRDITVSPILLRKGETQLALYGLSHIPDARLIRLFQTGKVVMETPDASSGEWFNIMVFHQNRADRGIKNYIPEEVLPDFLDLVLWGHEHDCRVEPEENPSQNFFVTQPGSSVATSLSEGEALPKHVAILHVMKKEFKIIPLPLKTVRPFIFESMNLLDYLEEYGLDEADASEKVQKLATEKMEEMIERAQRRLTDNPAQPKLPLIRLRILYSEEVQMFNGIRFGQQYNDRVANPADVILFKKIVKKTKFEKNEFDKDAMNSAFHKEETDTQTRVEDVVDRYFDEVDESKKLQIMTSKILSEICFRLVEKNDTNAAENIINLYKEKAIGHLMAKLPNEEAFDDEIQAFRANGTMTYEGIMRQVDSCGTFKPAKEDDIDMMIEPVVSKAPPKKTTRTSKLAEATKDSPTKAASTTTRGRGRGRGGARGRGRGANTSSSGHTMPPLDISMGSKSSQAPKKQTLLDCFNQKSIRTRTSARIVYEDTSDSD